MRTQRRRSSPDRSIQIGFRRAHNALPIRDLFQRVDVEDREHRTRQIQNAPFLEARKKARDRLTRCADALRDILMSEIER